MRAPRAKKPDQIAEALRVLAVYDLLLDGLQERRDHSATYRAPNLDENAAVALLAIAERIAARTEAE